MNIHQLLRDPVYIRSVGELDKFWVDPLDRVRWQLQDREWFCPICGDRIASGQVGRCFCRDEW